MGDCRKSFKLQDLLSHEQFALWRKPQSLQSGDMRLVWCLSDQEIFEFTKYTTQRWPSVDVALAHLQTDLLEHAAVVLRWNPAEFELSTSRTWAIFRKLATHNTSAITSPRKIRLCQKERSGQP